jgi:hypothetical protein
LDTSPKVEVYSVVIGLIGALGAVPTCGEFINRFLRPSAMRIKKANLHQKQTGDTHFHGLIAK